MFYKLALRNVGRSLKDYWVYFMTLLFGVCVFYVFNSLGSQPALTMLAADASYIVKSILGLMDILSVFVTVVLFFLILYGNNFMFKRRKKELATYLLLGLPQHQVSLLFFLETMLIGAAALALGLILGGLAAQGLSLLTLGMFQVDIPQLHFVLDPLGALKTARAFALIFLLVTLSSAIQVSRCKLGDFMGAGRRNETLKERPLWFSVAVFLLGVALILAAYRMLFALGLLAVGPLFYLMLFLGALGTLLFFRGLSGFLLKLCQSSKKHYYKGLNMFILRQWSAKVHSTYLSATVICLMLLLAIGITASSVGLNATIGATAAQELAEMPPEIVAEVYGSMEAAQEAVFYDTFGTKLLVLFLGLYAGVVFLLASAAVLALQQLSQAADNAGRYAILSRLGVPEQLRRHAIFVQVLLAFLLPLSLAIVHALVGMTEVTKVIALLGEVDIGYSGLIAAGLLLSVYGTYFLATYWGSQRIVRGD